MRRVCVEQSHDCKWMVLCVCALFKPYIDAWCMYLLVIGLIHHVTSGVICDWSDSITWPWHTFFSDESLVYHVTSGAWIHIFLRWVIRLPRDQWWYLWLVWFHHVSSTHFLAMSHYITWFQTTPSWWNFPLQGSTIAGLDNQKTVKSYIGPWWNLFLDASLVIEFFTVGLDNHKHINLWDVCRHILPHKLDIEPSTTNDTSHEIVWIVCSIWSIYM